MPHCVIEHSGNFESRANDLIKAVFDGALRTNLFNQKDIKTRTLSYSHFLTGGSNKPFIHISAKMLAGRSQEQKQNLSEAIKNGIETLALGDCALTIEIIDIEKETYFKSP